MRHRKFSQRLSRPPGHRRATLRNLVTALFKYQRIKTTVAKAKLAQSFAERLISLGKQNSLFSRRLAYKILADRDAVTFLFSRIAPLFKTKHSGFTRVIRLANARHGDGAEMAILELTERLPAEKPKKEVKKEKVTLEQKPSAKIEQASLEIKPEEKELKPQEKEKPVKEKVKAPPKFKPKKFLGGLRRLLKRERDSL